MENLRESKILEDIHIQSEPFFRLMAYYKCAMMEIETKLNVLNEEFSLKRDRNPINNIKCRVKSIISIKEKLERLEIPYSLQAIEENLHDVAGIRVCCSFVDDVYLLADALLRQSDVTLIAKKDYIKNPKPNGYRSLHLIVSIPIFLADHTKQMHVEIQLRTVAMDSWASLEHQLNYKKDVALSDEMSKDLYHCAELSAKLDETMANLHRQIFSK